MGILFFIAAAIVFAFFASKTKWGKKIMNE